MCMYICEKMCMYVYVHVYIRMYNVCCTLIRIHTNIRTCIHMELPSNFTDQHKLDSLYFSGLCLYAVASYVQFFKPGALATKVWHTPFTDSVWIIGTCIHVCTYVCTHVYMYAYVHTYAHVCMCVYVCMHVYLCICVYVCTCQCACVSAPGYK